MNYEYIDIIVNSYVWAGCSKSLIFNRILLGFNLVFRLQYRLSHKGWKG